MEINKMFELLLVDKLKPIAGKRALKKITKKYSNLCINFKKIGQIYNIYGDISIQIKLGTIIEIPEIQNEYKNLFIEEMYNLTNKLIDNLIKNEISK
jgi:hypothetical protein